jgi:hypothetical protein
MDGDLMGIILALICTVLLGAVAFTLYIVFSK